MRALVQPSPNFNQRHLDVLPQGKVVTGELVPGTLQEGDHVVIKDDSVTLKNFKTAGLIYGNLLEATVVKKLEQEDADKDGDRRAARAVWYLLRVAFTFDTVILAFDSSELEAEQWLRLKDGHYVKALELSSLQAEL